MFFLGLAMIALTVARGGGPLAAGVIMGILFAILGAVRYTAASHTEA